MEESWENFHLPTDQLDCGDDYFIDNCDNVNTDGDDFLREILLQTPQTFSSESEISEYSFQQVQNDSVTVNVNGVVEVVGNMVKSNSSNSIVSQKQEDLNPKKVPPRRCSLPKTYILSFDNSTMIPATPEPCLDFEGKRDSPLVSNKRSQETKNGERKTNERNGVKRPRSGSQTVDHIMAERKRRQELTERFIALSATIPGLSKTDKASILRAAIDYVKQLQERVNELEKEDKNVGVASVMVLKKTNLCGNNDNEDTNSCETNCDDDCNNILPEIEARVMGKEVLIEIHCKKQNGIELKLLNHLENLQLFVTGSSVLPFGKSAISITIIGQMSEGYKVTGNDLVKSIRKVLLKPQMVCGSDPY